MENEKQPTNEEWYDTTLKIKKFCEERDMQLSDTHYGWLSTLFFELKNNTYSPQKGT